jgi:lipoprotein-releasing system permease protein
VRGIETKSAKPFAGISKNIVLGEFDFEGSNTKGIVLGFTLADRLGAVIGDTLSIVSPAGFEFAFLQLGQPIIRRFKVIGIYESNNKDYDLFYSYVNLSMAQELFHMNKMISGLEVRLSNFEFAPMYKNKIQAQLGNGFRIFSWYDLHRDLYTVMKIEHWLAYIILGLIIGVASFNLLGLLTMSVIEKTRDIGILKSIGATGKSIVKIHMAQGILVGVSGTVFGIGLGLLLVYMQQQYHLFPLDPTVYIIPAIPVEVKISDLIAIAVMSIGFCSIAAIYPAKRASRLIPAEAIRWE